MFFLLLFGNVKGQSTDSLLSVEETLRFMKTVYMDHVPAEAIELSKRANPAAREEMYRILNDPNQSDIWPQVVAAFAYLGQQEDVAKLEDFLLKRRGTLGSYEHSAVTILFITLGGMGERGIPEARNKLKEMTTQSYWNKTQFRLYSRQPSGYLSFENQMRINALNGYAYTLSNDFDSLAAEVLNSVKDPREKTLMNERVKESATRNMEYRRSVTPEKNEREK